jgi:protease-4
MKINLLVNEIARGQWAMSVESLNFWAPQANKILKGKNIKAATSAKSLIDYFDQNQCKIKPDDNGNVNIPQGSVAVVNIIGPIIPYGDYCNYGSDEIVEKLYKLNSNSNISAIVVNIDGPGGSVSAVAPFLDFGKRRNMKKPLGVVYDMACSAHLYIMYGLQPNFVWASNGFSSLIGSIGVVFSFMDNTEWMKLNGFKLVEIYADQSPDKNAAFKLALEGKFELIKEEMLNPLAIHFQNEVKRLRPQLKYKEPGVITGKTFYADDAISLGFADKIGSLNDAVQYVQILSETKSL